VQFLLLRYTQPDHANGADRSVQSASLVDQQLCRWLLLSLDRLPSNQ